MDWAHSGTAVVAAFLASLVEFVEALTIVLAVGVTRGWRPALVGAAGGVVVLAGSTFAFGPALQRVPLADLQLVIGTLLVLFGMRWLRKAMLRAAGVIGLHDEGAIYLRETEELAREPVGRGARLDWPAMAASFKAVVLEGLEVVFIVLATGVGGQLVASSVGAGLAGGLVLAVGVVVHRPLTRVPENTLKFAVGVLLSAFGVFWIGEGMGLPWPGEDLSLLALVAGFGAVSGVTVLTLRTPSPATRAP